MKNRRLSQRGLSVQIYNIISFFNFQEKFSEHRVDVYRSDLKHKKDFGKNGSTA